jgi:hypothetical protein
MRNPVLPETPAKGLQGFTIHFYRFVNGERISQPNYSTKQIFTYSPSGLPIRLLPVW